MSFLAAVMLFAAASPAFASETTTGSLIPTDSAAPTSTTFVVVIDAGHQGIFSKQREPIGPGSRKTALRVAVGTHGRWTHVAEYVRTLQIALRLQKALEAQGVQVIMIRTKNKVNISNAERSRIANAAHANLLVRLHCDGYESSRVRGITVLAPAKNKWTAPIYKSSAVAARLFNTYVIKATGAKNRGISYRGDLSGFNWSKTPTVILEMGFMTNKTEDKLLGTAAYQDRIAAGVTTATMRFLSQR